MLKLPKSTSVPRPIHLQLTTVDSSLRVSIYAEPSQRGITFILPPLENVCLDSEEDRLFNLEFMDKLSNLPKGPFKFICIK